MEVLLHEMQSQETRSIVAHDGSFCPFFNCIGGVKRQEQVVVPQFEARQKQCDSMAGMSWRSILSVAKTIGSITLIFGIIVLQVATTKRRIAKYKKSGRFIDLLKIFSRY